ncbi:PHP domain-like protein [Atractiella rhizophila]|nr:PHP domain-like protein [Atractiella rhizophila]
MDLSLVAQPSQAESVQKQLRIAQKLGYTCVALNTQIPQTFDPAQLPLPKPPLPDLDPRTNDEAGPSTVPRTTNGKLLQLSRATIEIDQKHITGGGSKKEAKIYQLSTSNLPHFAAYNILSVLPTDSASLSYACLTLAPHIEIIVLQASDQPGGKSPLWGAKRSTIRAAIKAGCFFEIRYAPLLSSQSSSIPHARRNFTALLKSISALTDGKGLIVSSHSASWETIRAPHDLINILETMGLNGEKARAAVSDNPRKAVLRGFANRQTYRGVISAPILTTTIVTVETVEDEDEKAAESELIPTDNPQNPQPSSESHTEPLPTATASSVPEGKAEPVRNTGKRKREVTGASLASLKGSGVGEASPKHKKKKKKRENNA